MLNEQQAKFIEAYVDNGGNAVKAAKAAGYATDRSNASKLVRRLAAEINTELQRKMASKTSQALTVLELIMIDPTAANRDRLRAAAEILDRAGGLSRISRSDVQVADKGFSYTDEAGNKHMGIVGKGAFILPPKQVLEDDED